MKTGLTGARKANSSFDTPDETTKMNSEYLDLSQRPKENALTFYAKFAFAPALVLSAITIIGLSYPDWVTSDLDHFYLELFAVVLAGIVAFYALLRAYVQRELFILFMGLAFLASAVIDLLHGSISLALSGFPMVLNHFIPQTWFAGRILFSSLMLVALFEYKKLNNLSRITTLQKSPISMTSHDYKNEARTYNKILTSFVAIIASFGAGFLLISLSTVFPTITVPFIIHRPYELAPLVVLSVALFYFYKFKLHRQEDLFYRGLCIALTTTLFVQIVMAFSTSPFDTMFNVAHLLKVASYLAIVVTLALSWTEHGKKLQQREKIIENQFSRIRKLQTRYTTLYEESPQMYRTVDVDGIIRGCNKSYVKNLGYSSKNEVIGKSILDHVAESDLKAMTESFEEWKAKGSVKNKEVWLKRKDGSTFPALVSANTLYDSDGKLVGSNTVISDETEIYSARKQLEKANEEVRKAQEMREEFLRIAAHELRTPIQPIMGFAVLAKRGHITQDKAWEGVLREARRLQKLANDILDVSRIESGNMKYDARTMSINEIIAEAAELASVEVYGKSLNNNQRDTDDHVSILTTFDRDVEIKADRTRIGQALSNIIGNSIKFTNKGSITIQTRVANEAHLVEVKIVDTGSGIPAEVLPRLFEKFATKSSGTTEKHGTGLGLFISKSIVEAHGGSITAENNLNETGATFTIILPTADQSNQFSKV